MSENHQETELKSERAVLHLDWKEIYQLDEFSSVYVKEPGIRYVVVNKYYAVGVEKPMLRFVREIVFFSEADTEAHLNGVKNEHLIAILINRLGFLDEKFPCPENKASIEALKTALNLLEQRTKDRIERGVDGKLLP